MSEGEEIMVRFEKAAKSETFSDEGNKTAMARRGKIFSTIHDQTLALSATKLLNVWSWNRTFDEQNYKRFGR